MSHIRAMLNLNNMKHRQEKVKGEKWLMESINHVGVTNLIVRENGDFLTHDHLNTTPVNNPTVYAISEG